MVEGPEENVKEKTKEICRKVLPEDDTIVRDIDVVHRIGRKLEDGNRRQLPRPVIIRFTSRTARDSIWKGSKKNNYLLKNGLQFKEDLTSSDNESAMASSQGST